MGIARPRLGTFAVLLALLVVSLGSRPMRATTATPPGGIDGSIRAAIEATLSLDTKRGAVRLPSVHVDDTGDLTVVFALRDEGSLDGIRAAAEADVLTILRAVYGSPHPEVRTTTVVGTFSVTGTGAARELPMLRIVLPADRAATIDWATAKPEDLFAAAATYRLYPPLGDEEGRPIAAATPAASPAAETEAPVISSPVDIGGGRLLFLRCIGSGGPTVILEAGYGDDGTIWAPVQLPTSSFIRVCSYDRAGLSRSDPPDHYPRTAADVVADLHALLTAADVAPPYVLVGHSYGALFSRLYAATYPNEVAGLVLVDPWPEDYDARLRALVSQDQWTAYEARLAEDPDYEAIDFEASFAQVRAAGSLPPVPLLILSHGRSPDPSCCPSGWPLAAQEALWQELETGLLALSPNSRQIVVPASGHMIHQADPGVVVDAIATVVAEARQAGD